MGEALAGQSFVVVGGTTGLGISGAQALITEGANVVVVGRNQESVESALSELGPRARGLSGDATEGTTPRQAIALCVESFGAMHGLYHVAGGSGRRFGDAPLHEITEEGWQATIDLNLKSLFNSNQAATQHFLETNQPGSILNMSSVLATSPSIHHFATHAYAAAKSAAIGFSRSCAAYYAPHGIRFNVVCPALVETPMAKRAFGNEAIMKFISTKMPLENGRGGIPSDLDAAVVFFLSRASAMVTGQVLDIDGGWSLSEGQL